MASKKMREEATCSICLHLMTNAVSINCGHSYCQACIVSCYQMQPWKNTFCCPQCRAPFNMASLRPNKQLGNLIEVIKEMDQEMSCEEHGEKLHLFCEDEGQLICWLCDRGPQHKGHATALVEEVCQGYKEKLQQAVTKLRQLQEECMNLQLFTAEQITKWNEKIEAQKQKIQSDFKTLQSFLHEEEKSYLWKLEEEKEQTLRRLRDNKANLQQKNHELQNHILELENKYQGSAQKLLQDVKDTLSRSCAVKLEPPEALSLDLHTVCNVSELYFDVKKMLRRHQEYIMRNAGRDEAQAGIKIARRNINNLSYADDTSLMAESEEELKSLLMKVKEESEKIGLKLNIQKTKIMASGPITSWQIDGETVEIVTD